MPFLILMFLAAFCVIAHVLGGWVVWAFLATAGAFLVIVIGAFLLGLRDL